MFDINEAFIQALQKQELEEAIDYKKDRYNATTAEDTADEREFYGKHMTKRDKVRSLDQAKRNLERIGKDPRVTTGQAVDQISFEDTLYTDIANYKDNKNWAKKSAEKGDTLWADEHNKQANKFADKIRAKYNKKQESASLTVTQDVNSEDEALDLVNDTSYFNIGDEVEVKDWNGRTYTVKKTKDIKYKNGKRVEEAVETNINVNDPEISKDRMKELMPKMLEFIKENDYKNHYFENLAQNGMYSRMRIFGGLSDKFYDYVQAYEQVISAMSYENKIDYVTNLIKYDKDILGLSNEECPLVTTNLTVRKEIANRLNIDDNAPESIVTESKEKTKLTYKYTDNGQYYYEDEKGRLYVDMSDVKDKTDLYRCVGDYDEPSHSVNVEDFELINNPKNDENYERNKKYEYTYMLLSRLVMDCKYYLGNGNRFDGHLWAGSVDKQIAKMKELWNTLPEDMKPEWLSMEDIENYEKEMKKEDKQEMKEENKKLEKEAMEKEKAEKFGITDKLDKLTNDLMSLDYVTKVDYDLDGYYDNINAPITLVSFNIDVEDEEYSASNYIMAKRRLKRQVLDVMKNNGVNVEMEEFEDNDDHFYIVAYSTNWTTEKKTEAEETTNTISHELHTDLLPILNMYQYDIADGVEISREELNEVMQDKAMPIIEETIKTILPTAEVKAGKFYNPPYYRFGSGNNDQLDFTVTVPVADYEQLKAETISKDDFEDFLKETYKSYDGFISYMPNTMKEFDEAEDWKQFVVILSYYITPYEHQQDFEADVLDYIWSNFPTEDDEDEYDDGDTNWVAEQESEADERMEARYGNKEESKKLKIEASQDLYNKIKEEPRTEKFEKGSKLKDEIIEAWKNNDLKTAYTKWEELYTLFSTEEDFTEEQNLRNMIELTMITDQIEDKCVYDVTDYGKDQEYRKMGYRK